MNDDTATPRHTRTIRTVRHLHRRHFAFVRALIQGMREADAWALYLAHEEVGQDARSISAMVRWIQHEFALAARKENRYSLARLMRINVAEIPLTEPTPLPDLDEWAAANGWAGFGEAQVIDAYTAAFPSAGQSTQTAQTTQDAQKARQRGRLMARQLDALNWLEDLLKQSPRAGDACAVWFTPATAKHLSHAGVDTLADLVNRINGLGLGWSRAIAAIGPKKAQRLTAWLDEHADTTGLAIKSHARIPHSQHYPFEREGVVPTATAIRPLEKLAVPQALDGRAGRYRQPQSVCLLSATNDYEAVLAWINSKQGPTLSQKQAMQQRQQSRDDAGAQQAVCQDPLSNTQRSYRKEAERLLLWSLLTRRKALSSLTTEDATAYRDFLADPQPVADWCGPRSRQRWSPLWRPFEGPLSPRTQRHALTVLKNLYRFLNDQNYLSGNPWSGVTLPRTAQAAIDTTRSFKAADWQWISQQLAALTPTETHLRLQCLLHMLYATGLRLSEVCAARLGDLRWVEYANPDSGDHRDHQRDHTAVVGWELSVIGKGDKARDVVVPDALIAPLKTYVRSRGLSDQLSHPDLATVPLFGTLVHRSTRANRLLTEAQSRRNTSTTGLSARTVYGLLKAFFADCAKTLDEAHPGRAKRFQRASTHWLRHTHASHSIARGVPLEITQTNLGHASLATTTIYVTTEKARRMQAMHHAWEKDA